MTNASVRVLQLTFSPPVILQTGARSVEVLHLLTLLLIPIEGAPPLHMVSSSLPPGHEALKHGKVPLKQTFSNGGWRGVWNHRIRAKKKSF